MINKFRTTLMLIMAIITIMGIVTFSLFILEEAMQTVMFGTWPAQDANDWGLVLKGVDTNRKINRTLRVMTYTCGWIQPFAFVAYRQYAISMDYYIEALEAKILTKAPEVMMGRKLSINFAPRSSTQLKPDDSTQPQALSPTHPRAPRFLLRMGRLHLISNSANLAPRQIEGELHMIGKKIYLMPNEPKGP